MVKIFKGDIMITELDDKIVVTCHDCGSFIETISQSKLDEDYMGDTWNIWDQCNPCERREREREEEEEALREEELLEEENIAYERRMDRLLLQEEDAYEC
jgi:hypothetical protein